MPHFFLPRGKTFPDLVLVSVPSANQNVSNVKRSRNRRKLAHIKTGDFDPIFAGVRNKNDELIVRDRVPNAVNRESVSLRALRRLLLVCEHRLRTLGCSSRADRVRR